MSQLVTNILDADQLNGTLMKRYDSDGKIWIYALAHGDLTANTAYKVIMNEYGRVTAALADDTTAHWYYVGVPAAAVTSGTYEWLQIGGYNSALVVSNFTCTQGYGIKIYDGVVTSSGADFSGIAGEFGVCTADAAAASTVGIMLTGELIEGTS